MKEGNGMIHSDIYKNEIKFINESFFGKREGFINVSDINSNDKMLKAFIDDIDIQQIQIVSGNIGCILTYMKEYKK